MSLIYFAYGSNMSSLRLGARIPSARALGRARLEDHRLLFNKRSVDGSGKANLVRSAGHVAWGVAYEVDHPCWDSLDSFERGYRRTLVSIHLEAAAESMDAQTYLALQPSEEIAPYDWYLEHLLDGAREFALPSRYLETLRATSVSTGHVPADPRR